MNFGNQTILYGLFALPLVVIFYLYVFRRKKSLLLRLGSWELIKRLLPTVSRPRQILKAGMLILALALLVFSLSRPQYGSIERPITRKGVDIFIAIDTSLSMLARDIQPSRLARAEEQLNGLIHRLRGDRVGIITFAGTAFVQCPLTLDYALAQNILETIDADSVPIAGTAIGMAIRTATNAFERSAKGEKVLVLLTDGEDHETDPLGAAQEAAKAGVKIYSIGIGSEKGEPIRLPDGSFKKDSDGRVVNSRLDLVLLQKIAQATGGKTIKANPKGSLELDVLYADIGLIQKKTLRSQTYTIYEERFQYFLLPVILLLIMEMLTGDRKRSEIRRSFNGGGVAVRRIALMLLLPLIFGFTLTDSLSRLTRQGNHAFEEGKLEQALEIYKNAQVESPESPELHFNIGNVLLKSKKYEEAIKEFEQAAALLKEPSRMADAHYNIGVAQYRMAEQLIAAQNLPEAAKKLEECMASNQQAMKRNARDADPKFNYEQAKRLWKEILEKMKEQQKNQEQKQQEQQKNEGEKKEGEQKEKQSQSQNNEQKKEEQAKAQEQKQEEKKAEQGQKEKETKEEQQAQQQETKVGEMSKDDALRLLSTLPQENRESLKEALKHQYQGRTAPEKDW